VLGGWDTALFYWINRWPEWLRSVMWFFTDGIQLAPVRALLGILVVAMFALRGRPRRTIFQTLLAVGLGNETTDVMKAVFQAPRPFQELPDVILRVGGSDSFGTASAHSANMAAVAFVFSFHLRSWGLIWVGVALLTGLSRIYNGVHYPSQVLLGWLCGAFAGLVVTRTWTAYQTLRKRRTDDADSRRETLA
jgi:undecaprenyl-diphosphatase